MPDLKTANDFLQLKKRALADVKEFFLEVDRLVLDRETTGLILPGEIMPIRFKLTWEIVDAFLVNKLRANPDDEGIETGENEPGGEDLGFVMDFSLEEDEADDYEDDDDVGLDDDDDDDDYDDYDSVTYLLGVRLWISKRKDQVLATVFAEVEVDDDHIAWIQARKIESALGWCPIIQEDKKWPGTYLTVKNFDLTKKLSPEEVAQVVLEATDRLREFCLND